MTPTRDLLFKRTNETTTPLNIHLHAFILRTLDNKRCHYKVSHSVCQLRLLPGRNDGFSGPKRRRLRGVRGSCTQGKETCSTLNPSEVYCAVCLSLCWNEMSENGYQKPVLFRFNDSGVQSIVICAVQKTAIHTGRRYETIMTAFCLSCHVCPGCFFPSD